MKKFFVSIVFSLLIIGTTNFPKEVSENYKSAVEKSVAYGKKLSKFRETVLSPALGEKAWEDR